MTDAKACFDRDEVLEEYDEDYDFIAKMAEILRRDVDSRLPKIREAIKSADGPVLEAEAHALKSGVGNFFATEAYESAFQLELIGQNGNLDKASQSLSKLEIDLENLFRALSEIQQSE